MKNVLVIYSARIPTVEIVCNIMRTFVEQGELSMVEQAIIDVDKQNIEWSDILLAIRPFDISAHRIIEAAYNAHKKVIVYLDDDLLHLPNVYSSRLRKIFTMISFRKNCSYLLDILKKCDVFWGSSPFLLSQYKDYVKRGRCVCTNICVNMQDMCKPRKKDDNFYVLYAGSGNHYKQLNKLVIPAINALSDKYSQITLVCVGFRKKNIAHCKGNMIVIPWTNYDEYYSMIRELPIDIGVAPILQEDFYRCKYFNKYIEYTLLGAVGVYTDDYPYKQVVVDGWNGFLADNTVKSWMEKLEFALLNPDLRTQAVLNAQKYCREKLNFHRQMEDIYEQLPEFFHKEEISSFPVNYKPLRIINVARKYANRFVALYEELVK